MRTRITIEQLEQMRTHELADLLANISMLLKRMPDVVYSQLIPPIPSDEVYMRPEPVQRSLSTSPSPTLTRAELQSKTLAELKKFADDLSLSYPKSTKKKDDLIEKILAKSVNGHSEHLAIAEPKDMWSEPSQQSSPAAFTEAELKEKKKPELQRIADGLFISYNQKTTVGELIRKILARPASGHSEQFAILDL